MVLIKKLWKLSMLINILSLILFCIGATAVFQKSMYLEYRLDLFILGVPSICLLVLSIIILYKNNVFLKIIFACLFIITLFILFVFAIYSFKVLFVPIMLIFLLIIIYLRKKIFSSKKSANIINILIALALALVFLSFLLIVNTNLDGWLVETVREDEIQTTSDNKYEYKIQFINAYQKNSTARLYLKDINTKEVKYVEIYLSVEAIDILCSSSGGYMQMKPTNTLNIYNLFTIKDNYLSRQTFKIDVTNGTSVKIK